MTISAAAISASSAACWSCRARIRASSSASAGLSAAAPAASWVTICPTRTCGPASARRVCTSKRAGSPENTTWVMPGATLAVRTTVALPGCSTTAAIGVATSASTQVLRVAGNNRATVAFRRMAELLP
ncbi:hypothetical protein D3C86_1712400 [compost metagenome]